MGSQQREDFLSQRGRCVLREQIRVRTQGPAPLPFTGLEPSGHTQDGRVQERRTKLGLLLDLLDALPNMSVCVCVQLHVCLCVCTRVHVCVILNIFLSSFVSIFSETKCKPHTQNAPDKQFLQFSYS